MFDEIPAKSTACTPFIWFWPTVFLPHTLPIQAMNPSQVQSQYTAAVLSNKLPHPRSSSFTGTPYAHPQCHPRTALPPDCFPEKVGKYHHTPFCLHLRRSPQTPPTHRTPSQVSSSKHRCHHTPFSLHLHRSTQTPPTHHTLQNVLTPNAAQALHSFPGLASIRYRVPASSQPHASCKTSLPSK